MAKFSTRRSLLDLLALYCVVVLVTGCAESESPNRDAGLSTNAATTRIAANKAKATGQPLQNRGLVKSVSLAGGYIYVEVDVLGEIFWLATSTIPLGPGEKISWNQYALMTDFTSKSLDRVFERILFVDRLQKESPAEIARRNGVVEEALQAAGYSFIRVKESTGSVWLAAPATVVRAGQTIRWTGGAPMRNFTSRTLNRVFDEILFVGSISVAAENAGLRVAAS